MQRISLLQAEVDITTIEELNNFIMDAILFDRKIIIGGQNLHGIYLNRLDQKRKQFLNTAQVIRIDGMPLIYWGKLLGYPLEKRNRVTYLDWIWPLCQEINQNRWRLFYLGAKPGIAEKAASIIKSNYPNLEIQTHHGYFTSRENIQVLEKINAFKPNILMVGMGMPRQEHWVLDNLERIEANAILTAGACFDYIAGAIPTPPRWMGQIGLEWLYRLLSEPSRLAKRYLYEPWFLLPLAFKDLKEHFVSRKVRKKRNSLL